MSGVKPGSTSACKAVTIRSEKADEMIRFMPRTLRTGGRYAKRKEIAGPEGDGAGRRGSRPAIPCSGEHWMPPRVSIRNGAANPPANHN